MWKSIREIFSRMPADGHARNALRSFNMLHSGGGKAKSVKELAEKLGFGVDREPLGGGVAGYLEQDPFTENGYRIVVNSQMSVQQQRWAVLHEIGHFYLHSPQQNSFITEFRDRSFSAFYDDPLKEREADMFADVLLFGDGALEAATGMFGEDKSQLARHFGVTETVISIALKKYRTNRK